jgi:signal transduction histidine kinase
VTNGLLNAAWSGSFVAWSYRSSGQFKWSHDQLATRFANGGIAVAAKAKDPVGLLVAGGAGVKRKWLEHRAELFTTLGRAVAIAVDNINLLQKARQQEEQLRELVAKLADTEENERRRIAAEIHDWMGKRFFDFYYSLRYCQEACGNFNEPITQKLIELTESARQCADEIRRFMKSLYPSVLDDFGFVEALKEYVSALEGQGIFKVDLKTDGECDLGLTREVNRTLFRILEEAVLNARKHAEASHLFVELKHHDNQLRLIVSDDGRGFDPTVRARGHYGLLHMQERARSCGGTFNLISGPGRGTTIEVTVPLAKPAPGCSTLGGEVGLG